MSIQFKEKHHPFKNGKFHIAKLVFAVYVVVVMLGVFSISAYAKTMTLDEIKKEATKNKDGTCLTAKPVKKKPAKKLYKAPPQTVIPAEEPKPCEIVQNIYYINEVVNNDYLGKLPRYPIENVTRVDSPNIFNSAPPFYWIGGIYPIEKEVIKYVKEPEILVTPLPASMWLLGSVLGLFAVFKKRTN